MLKNHLIIALRNPKKFKFISFVNIFGLRVGLTGCRVRRAHVAGGFCLPLQYIRMGVCGGHDSRFGGILYHRLPGREGGTYKPGQAFTNRVGAGKYIIRQSLYTGAIC